MRISIILALVFTSIFVLATIFLGYPISHSVHLNGTFAHLFAYQRQLAHANSNRTTDSVRRVLFLAYQRTGSSFTAGIFHDPKTIFYVYEPLDPLYAAMYGIPDEWTVPSDIFNHSNGSLRTISDEELRAIRWMIDKIFACNFSSLPPAILAHKYWDIFKLAMTHSGAYIKCLNEHKISSVDILLRCQRFIRNICGTRFNINPAGQEHCRKVLWGDSLATNPEYYTPNANKYRRSILNASLPEPFSKYFQCLIKVEPILTKCASKYFDEPCKEKKLRVIKTVRANMQVGAFVLKSYNNSYLIHLYRDPRGVVKSRLNVTWSQGLWSNRSAAHEAQLYCSQVLSDIRRRKALERQGYPDRIKVVVYDQFVKEVLLNLLDIYRFIGQKPSMKIKDQFRFSDPIKAKNQSAHATKWKKDLSSDDIRSINSSCSQFLDETGFKK